MKLSDLDDGQVSALSAVAELYLAETRWVLDIRRSPMFPESSRQEILRRRAVGTLITGGKDG